MRYDPRHYGAKCHECPLGPDGPMRDPERGWSPVGPEIHPGAVVLAVAENPAEEEVREGRPLVGRSGLDAWNPALTAIGRRRGDIDITNTICCMPPGGASGGYKRMEVQLKKLNDEQAERGLPAWPHPAVCCKPRLDRELSAYRRVVALGGTAAKAVTGEGSKILSIRGDVKVVGDANDPTTVLVTVHPAFVLRAPQWREFFEADIAKAFRWFEGKRNWTEPIYDWRPDPQTLRAWLKRPARFIAHDYETTMDGPTRSRIYCIGFARLVEPTEVRTCEKCRGSGRRRLSFNKDVGWIPATPEEAHLRCECCGGAGTRLVEVESILVPLMSCEDTNTRFYSEVEERQIEEVIREHMVDPSILKVFHNGWGFDQLKTEKWLGVQPWPTFDTLPVARARNPAAKKGLKVIGGLYCDIFAWGASTEGASIAKAPRSDKQLAIYCAAGDASVTAKIVDPLIADAAKNGYFRPLRPEIKPATWPPQFAWTLQGLDQNRQDLCRHLYRAGTFVDQERRDYHDVRLRKEAIKYRSIAQRLAHEHGVTGKVHVAKKTGDTRRVDLFNPGSDDQVGKLLFDVWEIPPSRFSELTGKASVDDETLREIITSGDLAPDRQTFLDAIRRYRRANKARSTFLKPLRRRDTWVETKYDKKQPLCWEDGRIRSSWSEMLTSVGRFSSREPNLQNFPSKLRDCFAAQPVLDIGDRRYPGRVLIGGDVDQFHLRIIANRWRVARLLEAFHEGIDPHSSLALDFFGSAFRHAEGWGPDGFSLKRKPLKGSPADKMRHLAKVLRYRGAYADTEEGLLQTVKKVEDPDTGDMPFAHMTLREVRRLYRTWMRAEPEWEHAWQWVCDQYTANGGWIEECVTGRRSGDLEGGKKQAVVNYDILAAEPAIFALIESDVRAAFPDHFEGFGTGIVSQVHDSINVETLGFAWTEIRNGRKVTVCDEATEKKRKLLQECLTRDFEKSLGWSVKITAEAQVGPVRDEHGRIKLSNWKEA